MSFITLITVEGDQISVVRGHYRKIMEILKGSEIVFDSTKKYLDAGYILIDRNLGLVLNEQCAFDINDIKMG